MTPVDTPRILTVTIEVNVPGHIEACKPDQIGAAALEFAGSSKLAGTALPCDHRT